MHLKEMKMCIQKHLLLQHFSGRNGAFSGKVPGVPILSSVTVHKDILNLSIGTSDLYST